MQIGHRVIIHCSHLPMFSQCSDESGLGPGIKLYPRTDTSIQTYFRTVKYTIYGVQEQRVAQYIHRDL